MTKEEYIKLIEKTGSNEILKDVVLAYLKSYSGQDTDELKMLVLSTILTLAKMDDLKIKADAFEALLVGQKEFDSDMASIKKRYDDIVSGNISFNTPVPSSLNPKD